MQELRGHMNKQTKMLKMLLNAWSRSEVRNKELQAEFCVMRDQFQTVKDELQTVRDELQTVKHHVEGELKKVHERMDAITAVVSNLNSPTPSYADVVRTPPQSQPSNVRTLSSLNTTPSTFTDTLYCTIDTSRVENGEGDAMTAGTIRAMVEKEIRTMDDHSSWRRRAVTVSRRK